MTDNVNALLAAARGHLREADQVRRMEGRTVELTVDQRIQLAQAYALLAIATRLNRGAEDEPGPGGGRPEVILRSPGGEATSLLDDEP